LPAKRFGQLRSPSEGPTKGPYLHRTPISPAATVTAHHVSGRTTRGPATTISMSEASSVLNLCWHSSILHGIDGAWATGCPRCAGRRRRFVPLRADGRTGRGRGHVRGHRKLAYCHGVDDDSPYDDGLAVLDDQGITLRRYYFPTGGPKHIPYARIRNVEVRPMGWLTGRGRVWGTGGLGYWLPLDLSRLHKDKLVVLDLGLRTKPAFSPDDPDRVVAIVRRRLGRA
jgi:hypothetical protein